MAGFNLLRTRTHGARPVARVIAVRTRLVYLLASVVIALTLLVAHAGPAARAAATKIPDIYAGAYGSDVFSWRGVTRNPANGLPMVRYPGLAPQWNYVTIALYGLQRWSDWRSHGGGSSARAAAINVADFLVSHQNWDGAWRYTFPFEYDDDGVSEPLPAGWVAAQAQGNVISLLSRMYAATGRSLSDGGDRRPCTVHTQRRGPWRRVHARRPHAARRLSDADTDADARGLRVRADRHCRPRSLQPAGATPAACAAAQLLLVAFPVYQSNGHALLRPRQEVHPPSKGPDRSDLGAGVPGATSGITHRLPLDVG